MDVSRITEAGVKRSCCMSAAPETAVVRKRDGRIVDFEPSRVATAIERAFRAEMNLADGQPFDNEILQDISSIVEEVAVVVIAREATQPATVEQIQDVVEMGLMRREHFRVARRYILYRTEHARMRAIRGAERQLDSLEDRRQEEQRLFVEIEPGVRVPFDVGRLQRFLENCVSRIRS
ncbi:MAG: ATP cone domain-containing protein, partial [Planctomycetota bacterium]